MEDGISSSSLLFQIILAQTPAAVVYHCCTKQSEQLKKSHWRPWLSGKTTSSSGCVRCLCFTCGSGVCPAKRLKSIISHYTQGYSTWSTHLHAADATHTLPPGRRADKRRQPHICSCVIRTFAFGHCQATISNASIDAGRSSTPVFCFDMCSSTRKISHTPMALKPWMKTNTTH